MKRLSFAYAMDIRTDAPIHGHCFTLRCVPSTDERQRITALQMEITPHDYLTEGADEWGNRLICGACREAHDRFSVRVSGTAETGLSDGVPDGFPMRSRVFRYATPLTAADEALSEFAEALRLPHADELTQAARVAEAVHAHLAYRPGTTDVSTSAAQAFAQKSGVCQDFSHVMLAILRAQGIPSRYAVGMLMGEGKSHAWVEVLCRNRWYGFDPTNDRTVTDSHITFSRGRDYADCRINRGVFHGFARQETEISAVVTGIG